MSNVFLDSDGWPLTDKLLADLYRNNVAVLDGSPVYSGTRFQPEPSETQPPAIRTSRLPGGGINSRHEDVARLEVLCLGRSRAESDSMLAQVRSLNRTYRDEGWAGVELDAIREESGPGRIPDPNPSVVAVPITLDVVTRQQGPGLGWAGMDEDATTGAPITP